MSTNSRIGIENEDGSIRSVYCHWDGYIAGVGYTLLLNYSDRKVLGDLIDLGNISSLGKNLYPKGDHTFESPEDDVTVFYGRDRNESDQSAEISPTMERFVESIGDCGEEFAYVLRLDGTWTIVERSWEGEGTNKVIETNAEDEIILQRARLIRQFEPA